MCFSKTPSPIQDTINRKIADISVSILCEATEDDCRRIAALLVARCKDRAALQLALWRVLTEAAHLS